MTVLGLILSFIPLALAAITPAMLVAVTFLLSLDRGLYRAWVFMAGRLLAYIGWCGVLYLFTERVFDLTLEGLPTFISLVKAFIGLLLIAMALKIALGGEDPDALPDKVVDLFRGISMLQLFGLGMLVSIFQVRHILLLFIGVTEVVVSELSILWMVLTTVILILMINASQLFLLGIYLILSDRADVFIRTMEAWLVHNNHRVALIIGLIGVFFLWDGISGLDILEWEIVPVQ